MATVQGIYLALFGRPADPKGLQHFEGLTKGGSDLTAIGDLSGQPEYLSRFKDQTSTQVVQTIYKTLFGREADAAGLKFYRDLLDKGGRSINDIAINILDGAKNDDKTVVDNKLSAMEAFTRSLDTPAKVDAYAGSAAARLGETLISSISKDLASIPNLAKINQTVSAVISLTGPSGGGTTTPPAAVNHPPVALDHVISINEDQRLALTMLPQKDSDGDGVTYSFSNRVLGTVDVGSVGVSGGVPVVSYVYLPRANVSGTERLSYTASDGKGGTATGTLTITINPVNDAPVIDATAVPRVRENSAGERLATFTVSDIDTASGFTFRVLGADGLPDGRFIVSPLTGVTAGSPGKYEVRLAAGASLTHDSAHPTLALTIEVDDHGATNNIALKPFVVPVVEDGTQSPITLVSVTEDGSNLSSFANGAVISADGSTIAFFSMDRTLMPGVTPVTPQLFVKDLQSGTVVLASSAADGTMANNSGGGAFLSADGKLIVFSTFATNLTTGGSGRGDIVIKNLETGTVTLVSTAADGTIGNGQSSDARLSTDGQLLFFRSEASNLVAGDTNGVSDTFIKNLATGAITRLVLSTDPTEVISDVSISANGQFATYTMQNTNNISNSNVYVRDLTTGFVELVSTLPGGTAPAGFSFRSVLSADGSKIAFISAAATLVNGDSNAGFADVFVKDLTTGQITLASVTADGVQPNRDVNSVIISPDGTKVAFTTLANNLAVNTFTNVSNIFIKDLASGELVQASTTIAGQATSFQNRDPQFSADGKLIFVADDRLLPEDVNSSSDIYIYDTAAAALVGHRPPVALNDIGATQKNTAVILSVLENDTDGDGGKPGVLSASSTNGTVVVLNNGQISFTPQTDFIGVATITYRVIDADRGIAQATAAVTVSDSVLPPGNRPPVAVDDTATTLENTTAFLRPLRNDSDPDGDPLTLMTVSAEHGRATIEPDGVTIRYTPNTRYDGLDTVTYTVSDGQGHQATAKVIVTITDDNRVPVITSEAATIAEDTTLTIDVLANDIDYDGDVLALGALQVLGGSVTQNGGGSLTFTPTPDFNGAASIIYDVVDGKGGVANGVVSITVTPVNDAPRLTTTGLDAQAGYTGITVGRFSISDVDLGARSMLGFRILDANGVVDDRFAVFRNNSATTQGRPGDYEVRLKAGLRLDYAAENADGDPRIQLTIEANDFETANNKGTANVTVTVLPGDSNRPPEATDDSGGTRKNESVMMSPLLNDDDPDGDTLTLISASALHGGVSIGQLNIITYTPDLDYVGDDVITYTISDGRGAAATARVFMTVYEDPDQQPTHLIRISVNASGIQGNGSSDGIAISKYGEEVAFSSFADNLVAGDVNGLPDIFLHDRVNGRNTLISAKADGTQSNGWSYDAAVSADGNRVAFTSEASNLVGGDSNGVTDTFVKNVATGALTRVSTASDGTQANEGSRDGIFSDDGNSLAFESYAGNLVAADSNGSWDIFVKDLVSGATTRVSTAADGSQGNGHSYNASFTGDGGTIAFESYADNLVAGDGNNSADIFVKTLATGAITRVSTTYDGIEANAGAYNPSLSADGTLVVFWSSANNLVADDFNGEADIFIKNLVTGTIERVSVNEGGIEADGASRYAVISSDGQKVAFVSTATNLVFGDNNGRQDVFVKNLREGTVTRISMPDESIEPDGLSYDPVISATGDIVGFWSEASNIVPGDTNSRADIFLYDPFGLPV